MKTTTINYLLSAFILLLMTGCDGCKGTPNPNDNTPPTIEWTVIQGDGKDDIKVNGTGSVNLKLGAHVSIIGCVVDDGGVKEITSFDNTGHSCTNGQLGVQIGPGLVVSVTDPLGLDDKGKAWTRYCKVYTVDLNFGCPAGFSFSSGTHSFSLSGKNFANLSGSGTLSLNVTP